MSKAIKNSKQLTAKKTHADDDVKRYVGMISEEFRGHIKVVAEQHGSIMRKLGEHDEQFRLADERHKGVMRKLEEHDTQFRHVDEQFRTVHVTLGGLKEDLEIIKGDIAMIKVDVRKRVTYDEFAMLAKRVALLEKKSHR